jgi:hypothetical protein
MEGLGDRRPVSVGGKGAHSGARCGLQAERMAECVEELARLEPAGGRSEEQVLAA